MPASSYATEIAFSLALLSETTNRSLVVVLSPSATLGEEIDIVGGSSLSVIVPVPVMDAAPPAKDAFVGLLSDTITVSFSSSVVSPVTVTTMSSSVSPAENVTEPEANV